MANINVKIKEFTDAKTGDLLGYNGKEWVPVSVENIIKDLLKQIESQQAQLESVRLIVKSIKEQVQQEITTQRQAIAELLKGIVK
jgi:hypothetical protein